MGCLFCGGARCTVAPDARRIARSGRLLKLGRSASSIQRTRPHPDRCGWRRWTLNTGLSQPEKCAIIVRDIVVYSKIVVTRRGDSRV